MSNIEEQLSKLRDKRSILYDNVSEFNPLFHEFWPDEAEQESKKIKQQIKLLEDNT
jgi:hypothetical protein